MKELDGCCDAGGSDVFSGVTFSSGAEFSTLGSFLVFLLVVVSLFLSFLKATLLTFVGGPVLSFLERSPLLFVEVSPLPWLEEVMDFSCFFPPFLALCKVK